MRDRIERRTGHSRPVLLYVLFISLAALALWGLLVREWGTPNAKEVLFFWALHMVAHLASVEVHVGRVLTSADSSRKPLTVTGGALLLMTAAFATDPSTAATVAIVPVFTLRSGEKREDVVRKAFNTGQEVLYAGSAAMIYALLISALGGGWPRLLAVAVSVATAAGLNVCLVAGVVSAERRWNPLRAMGSLWWPLVHSMSFGSVAFVVASLYIEAGPLAAVFILTPLFVLAQARKAKMVWEEAQERTLRAFVRAIELKDPYTSRHSERVAEIAVQLHRKLGASEKSIRRRFYGALMHDLGKVAVPGTLLNKPGRLSSDEYELVKRHPSVGAKVAEEVDTLGDLIPEILYHHERLDGGGYPSGLIADEIPMEAKVLAVADVFEALTSDRPYRRALSEGEAMAEIRRMVGTQLDGVPVAALEELLVGGYAVVSLPSGAALTSGNPNLPSADQA